MTTFTEVLPARKSSKSSAIQWTPVDGTEATPVAGILTVATERSYDKYQIEEFPTGTSARGFVFRKLTKGTDATSEYYTVFCRAELPEITGCDCKGMQVFENCKHADSANALVANDWI